MTLNERWAAYQEAEERDEQPQFALRPDGALVFFDAEGYFLIVGTGIGPNPGAPDERVENLLMLEDAKGNRESVYVEPIWLSGYLECFSELLEGKS